MKLVGFSLPADIYYFESVVGCILDDGSAFRSIIHCITASKVKDKLTSKIIQTYFSSFRAPVNTLSV